MSGTAEPSLTPTVYTVTPETTVAEAASLMAERNVGDVVVVKDMRPVGILTDRDIVVRAVAAGKSAGITPVRKVMSWPLVTITRDQDIGSAVSLMAQHGIRRIPIVDETGRLASILTLDDLLLLNLDGTPDLIEVLRAQLRSGKEATRPLAPAGPHPEAGPAVLAAPPGEGRARVAGPVHAVARARVKTPPLRFHRTWSERGRGWLADNLKWMAVVLVLALLGALAALGTMPFWRALYNYNPVSYEPKDEERQQYLIEREKERQRQQGQ